MSNMMSIALIAAGCVSSVIVLVLLVKLYRQESGGKNAAAQEDVANTVMLLQTMRDLLDQQKALAREFNKSLDNKVGIIRKVVRAVAEEHQKLGKTHEELNQMMAAARADLKMLRAYAVAIRGRVSRASAAASTPAAPVPPLASSPTPASIDAVSDQVRKPIQEFDLAPLEGIGDASESEGSNDLIDNWTGLDFGGAESDPYGFNVPEEVPEQPEDPESAREAFRKLLNIADEKSRGAAEPRESQVAETSERDNGRSRSTHTLRARVLEYSGAGMSVPEIARELGLGKGEVRLILSIGVKEAKHRRQRSAQRPESG